MKKKVYIIIIVYFVLILLSVIFIKIRNNNFQKINVEKKIDYEFDEVDDYYNDVVKLSKT